jgi:tRNA(Arg) A34 adenosine deaminase TadA
VIGWGWNEFKAKRDLTMHAEIAAMRDAAGRYPVECPDLILVTTLEPCVMCTGAAYLCGISTIIYALPAPADGGMGRVAPPSSPGIKPPEVVGPMRQAEVRKMFEQWQTDHPDAGAQGDFVRQLLSLT